MLVFVVFLILSITLYFLIKGTGNSNSESVLVTPKIDFVAIDFETANRKRNSPCAFALSVVKNGKVTETKSWLIKPYDMDFDQRNIDIHGITPNQVQSAPEFNQIWNEVSGYLEGHTVAAHYAEFDIGVLVSTLTHYKIPLPRFDYICSCEVAKKVWPRLYNHKLSTIADHLGIILKHHQADSDARACAEIILDACEKKDVGSISELAQKTKTMLMVLGKKTTNAKPKEYEKKPIPSNLDEAKQRLREISKEARTHYRDILAYRQFPTPYRVHASQMTFYETRQLGIDFDSTTDELLSAGLITKTQDPTVVLNLFTKDELLLMMDDSSKPPKKSWNKSKQIEYLIANYPNKVSNILSNSNVVDLPAELKPFEPSLSKLT